MPRLPRLPVLLALATAVPLPAQSVVGRVLDDETSLPVVSALVELQSERGQRLAAAVTDSSGRFHLSLTSRGWVRLRASRLGYRRVQSESFTVAAAEEVEVDLRISAVAVVVSPLTITSRPEPPRNRYLENMGFYTRERRANGLFVRRDRVEQSSGALLSDLLSGLPGVRRTRVRGNSVLGITFGRALNCGPQVIVDGQPIVDAVRIDDVIHVRAIEAMEIYRGPSETPVEFSYRERGCGLLVIWTRDRA